MFKQISFHSLYLNCIYCVPSCLAILLLDISVLVLDRIIELDLVLYLV